MKDDYIPVNPFCGGAENLLKAEREVEADISHLQGAWPEIDLVDVPVTPTEVTYKVLVW